MFELVKKLVLSFCPEEKDSLAEDSVKRVARYYELCDYNPEDIAMQDDAVYNLYYFDKLIRDEGI